ncbi:hypothetical protein GALL_425500 [mine drainage metagenome]|uniref:Uncharacterized protein n=1 Tax=mine drainage metagenome TaxID=410659 RepID=A0A1J5Q7E2_9ZZZZ
MNFISKTNPAFEPKAPDAIMAELWRTKQRINAEAGYDIDKLLARVKREQKHNLTTHDLKMPQTASNENEFAGETDIDDCLGGVAADVPY